jgi:hypothetical protein
VDGDDVSPQADAELMTIEACAVRLARTTTDEEMEDLALMVARLATLIREAAP